jgi:hypothetical protein
MIYLSEWDLADFMLSARVTNLSVPIDIGTPCNSLPTPWKACMNRRGKVADDG